MAATVQDIDACVFDAYGTMFNYASAAARFSDELGDLEKLLTDMWRVRQVEYTWLRSLMGEYVEFFQVTGEALDYAMASLNIDDADLRRRLLDVYMKLDCFPEVPAMLSKLRTGGLKTAILSNGSPAMLQAAVENAGISDDLDATYSVDSVGIYKPHPSVYQMAPDGLGVETSRVCFMSSNAWDAAAAANFGFRVIWINRYGQPAENIPGEHEHQLDSLEGLPALFGL